MKSRFPSKFIGVSICSFTEVVKMFQVPGFQSFVIETFATNCCLYSVLDKSFEFRDAHTVSYLFADWKKFRPLVHEKCYFEFTNP